MKRDKPSSEFKTFIKDFESHGVDIFAHLGQQQIEKYLELCQRHTFSQFEFYRNLIIPLDNSESEELSRFYNKLLSIEFKYTEKDGDISNLFGLFSQPLWKPSSFTFIKRGWYREFSEEAVFTSMPSSLPNPWPQNNEMVLPSSLYPIEQQAAWGWMLVGHQPLLGRLPDNRTLPIISPAEFAKRKLASIFTLRYGKFGPAPGWERDVTISISLLHARGAFIPARITEARFADILAKSGPIGGGN